MLDEGNVSYLGCNRTGMHMIDAVDGLAKIIYISTFNALKN